MTYNKQNLPRYVETAGKITILTALSGILIFAFVFLLNIGKTEFTKVEATSGVATTSVTVLNTPPQWRVGYEAREEVPSSSSTPTNSGNVVSWVATADDANLANYYLIICSTSATPTPAVNGAPTCSAGITWGVSTSTVSGQESRTSTTTTEAFSTTNAWFGWVCDFDVQSKCNVASTSQGSNATNSSPFIVNHRPVFTGFTNNGPINPGATVLFTSTSSDPDSGVLNDKVFLVVCGSTSYSTTTHLCGAGDTVASSSISSSTVNATTSRLLPSVLQDAPNYPAYPFVFDSFGHSATGSATGINVVYGVNNVAPTVAGGTISLNNGSNITLAVEAGETTGIPLSFIVDDANSCDAIGGGNADEITGFQVSVLRSGLGTSSCITSGNYNPNNCYTNAVATSTWNLICTASTTTCTAGGQDSSELFNCTFPLWFTSDPTDGLATDTPFFNQTWTAGVAGIDNNNATGSMSTTSSPVELLSYVAISLQTNLIAYDQLEPGQTMPTLTATTSIRSVGNTGINEILYGDSMCGTYSPSNPCKVSATSTIPANQQHYATSAVAFASGIALNASTSSTTLDIRVPKPTSTSTPSSGTTFWGISVPGTITLAGSYTGQNSFVAIRSATSSW